MGLQSFRHVTQSEHDHVHAGNNNYILILTVRDKRL